MKHCNYINEKGFNVPGKLVDVFAAHPAILITFSSTAASSPHFSPVLG